MGILKDKIYSLSPVWMQNIGISLYGFQWQKRRFGGIFHDQVTLFKERESYSRQQWLDYQTIELRKILIHAMETVPFYTNKYGQLGFTVNDFRKFELTDLCKLPYLTKQEFREFGTSSLLSSTPEKGGSFFSSSGSTGTPVKILYSYNFHQKISAAMEARVRNWAGVDYQTPRGMIGGRKVLSNAENNPPFYRYNFFEKQTYFSAYHISKKNTPNYLDGMRKNNVRFMTGYAMSNYLLASMLQEIGGDVPPLEAVITSSEKLTDQMRKTLQRVYGCKVFDSYSGVENCGLISENSGGQLLISPDVGIIETIDDKERLINNQEGELEIVCTGLLNYDQPLIRYRIGDCITRKLNYNNTESSFPEVASISGRVEDVITTSDGRQMVRFHGIFIDLEGVTEAQVIQHDFQNYTVRIVANNRYTENDKNKIIARIKSQLGNVKINVVTVESIERTKSGKLKAVISEIK